MSSSALLTSVEWSGLSLKNRMVLAPLTRGRAGDDRVPNKMMGDYYVQRCGGGMIITEATSVSAAGEGWVNSPSIYTPEQVEGWQSITQRVHQAGGKIILQLWHTGRASHSDFHKGELPVSASAVKLQGDLIHTPQGKKEYETPEALSLVKIKQTITDFQQAALNAKEAGFDGVEVHAANGYLINQFLDGRSNQRDDQFGGSIENRYRLLDLIIEAVTDVWPANRVGVRLSPNGVFNDMGCDDYRELYTYVATQLNQKQIGYLHVMDGLGFGFHERGEPMTLADFRQVFDGLLIGNVGYDKTSAEQRIADGDTDMIAFGRPWITNPDLPTRYKHDYPLNSFDDPSKWYGGSAEGYTDYKAYAKETDKEALSSI